MKFSATIPESVAMTGISRSAIYRAIKEKHLTPRKNGKRTLILVEDLKRYVESLPAAVR